MLLRHWFVLWCPPILRPYLWPVRYTPPRYDAVFFEGLATMQHDLPPEAAKVLRDHAWDLISDESRASARETP